MQTTRTRANEAAAVSRHLRTLGVVTLPSGSPRTRQGVRVESCSTASAVVTFDYDNTKHGQHVVDATVAAVREAGLYEVRINAHDSAIVYLTRVSA